MLQILTQESKEDTKRKFEALRRQFPRLTAGVWLRNIIEEQIESLPQREFYVVSTEQDKTPQGRQTRQRVHGGREVEGTTVALCKWQEGSKEGSFSKAVLDEGTALDEEVAAQRGSIFCPACFSLLIASDRAEVEKHFDCPDQYSEYERARNFRERRSALIGSLRQGDDVYVHCNAGLLRAPHTSMMAAQIMRHT